MFLRTNKRDAMLLRAYKRGMLYFSEQTNGGMICFSEQNKEGMQYILEKTNRGCYASQSKQTRDAMLLRTY
jgi:hypothetical protein